MSRRAQDRRGPGVQLRLPASGKRVQASSSGFQPMALKARVRRPASGGGLRLPASGTKGSAQDDEGK